MSATAPPRHRILLVHDGDGRMRGSETVVLSLIDNLGDTRFSWVVLTNHPEFAEAARSRGIPTELHDFRMLFVSGPTWRDLMDFSRFVRLTTRIARLHQVNIIHINNGGSCSWVVVAALILRLPTLVHLHSIWSARMQFLLGMNYADCIVGVSRTSLRNFARDPVACKRTRVIYNGVRLPPVPAQDPAAARRALGLPDGHCVIGVIGTLVVDKRVDVAIEALRQLPIDVASKVVLLVVGDGPERANLEKTAAGLAVTFVGHRDDVPSLLRHVIDMVVLPSATESLNLVMLEAAAAGLPRIASDVGGVPESLVHGVGGLLVPAGDAVALASAMTTLLRDPELARRYALAGQARIFREFSVEQFLGGFQALYDELATVRLPPTLVRMGNIARSISFQVGSRLPRIWRRGAPNRGRPTTTQNHQ